mgnify:CR=1 FL=1
MAKTIPADEKVFMVSKSTNTTYSGSAALKAMNDWYTMDDVTNTVRPYKVYTALLTQNGGDNVLNINGSPLTIGITYQIDDSSGGADYTNVGAPSNDNGIYFVATGTTPNSWGTGGGLNYNTGAPIATVLENTIGNVWFTFSNDGEYYANSNDLFVNNKTATFGGYYDSDLAVGFRFNIPGYDYPSSIFFRTNDGVPTNGYLQNTTIEIRVYN